MRALLLVRARQDVHVSGAAIVGSGGSGKMDRWSDIDLFLGVDDTVGVSVVLAEWTTYLYEELSAVHHFDLPAGPTIYRAFILPNLLEIDLGLTPASEFGPMGPGGFEVVFADEVKPAPEHKPLDPRHFLGTSWHHVLHGRIAIERGNCWQALHWIGALRDNTLALISLRHGRAVNYGKGADTLPAELTAACEGSLASSLAKEELTRALRAATDAFVAELAKVDGELATALGSSLMAFANQDE